jgi:hypothetical protein
MKGFERPKKMTDKDEKWREAKKQAQEDDAYSGGLVEEGKREAEAALYRKDFLTIDGPVERDFSTSYKEPKNIKNAGEGGIEQVGAENPEVTRRMELAAALKEMKEGFASEAIFFTAAEVMIKYPNAFNNIDRIEDPGKRLQAEKLLEKKDEAIEIFKDLVQVNADYADVLAPVIDELEKIKAKTQEGDVDVAA